MRKIVGVDESPLAYCIMKVKQTAEEAVALRFLNGTLEQEVGYRAQLCVVRSDVRLIVLCIICCLCASICMDGGGGVI